MRPSFFGSISSQIPNQRIPDTSRADKERRYSSEIMSRHGTQFQTIETTNVNDEQRLQSEKGVPSKVPDQQQLASNCGFRVTKRPGENLCRGGCQASDRLRGKEGCQD